MCTEAHLHRHFHRDHERLCRQQLGTCIRASERYMPEAAEDNCWKKMAVQVRGKEGNKTDNVMG
jgi:hypothetical protein